MSEETTEKLKTESTNPLPFEVVVTSQLANILSHLEQSSAEARAFRSETTERLDRLEANQAKLEANQAKLEANQAKLEAQQEQTIAELRTLNRGVYKMEERLTNLEYKMDSFFAEHISIKRELYKVQEAIGFKPGLDRLPAELGVNG